MQCTAKRKRTGQACRSHAVKGSTKCRMHGGKGSGRPYENGQGVKRNPGRYSRGKNKRVREYAKWLEQNDPDPLDILPDLVEARAFLVDYFDRLEDNNEGVMRWHASFQSDYKEAFSAWRESMINASEAGGWVDMTAEDMPSPPDPLDFVHKPRKLMDANEGIRLISTITGIVERFEKIKLTRAVTADVLKSTSQAIRDRALQALEETLEPEHAKAARDAMTAKWDGMQVDTVTGRILN